MTRDKIAEIIHGCRHRQISIDQAVNEILSLFSAERAAAEGENKRLKDALSRIARVNCTCHICASAAQAEAADALNSLKEASHDQ